MDSIIVVGNKSMRMGNGVIGGEFVVARTLWCEWLEISFFVVLAHCDPAQIYTLNIVCYI
jgi:hypothetical protein